MSTKKIIQPLGLHRSGTNYIVRLIVDNFDENGFEITESYWKHYFNPPVLNHNQLDNTDIIVLIYKNLFNWIESIAFRESYDYVHRDYLYHPLELTDPEFTIGPKKMNLINLAKTYNRYIENWLVTNIWLTVDDVFKNKLIVVNYEDLLEDVHISQFFQKLETYGIKRLNNSISKPALGDVEHSRFEYPENHLINLKNKKTYYLTDSQKQKAREQLSEQVINLIGKI